MSAPAIRIQEIGKEYQLGVRERGYRTLRESIVQTLKAPWRRMRDLSGHGASTSRFWALRDVSLEIPHGEVLGVIGHNGAGKSTLLKILSQITEPSTGRIELWGRVASLLEVGTGFHPELTGRENIFLNGAILGMRREEIRRKFDEIVDFAGVEEFLDTPVKRYSSGMHVRLAFAVAAHLDPEILLIDEVLAVGDAEFQNKCLGKMGQVARGGRTVVFVSHNMAAVEGLCSRAVLLEHGRLTVDGDVEKVIRKYLDSSAVLSADLDLSGHAARPPGKKGVFTRLRIRNDEGQLSPTVRIGANIRFEMELYSEQPLSARALGFRCVDSRGMTIFTCHTRHGDDKPVVVHGVTSASCTVRRVCLVPGRYQLQLFLRSGKEVFDEIGSGLEFEVLPLHVENTGKVPTSKSGVIVADAVWDLALPGLRNGTE